MNSIKENKFSKKLKNLKHLPNIEIIRRIDSKMFSLDGNNLYRYKPDVLAAEEYKRCLSLFEEKLKVQSSLKTQKAISILLHQIQIQKNMIFNVEMRNINELKQLAVDTIRSLFDIPNHVKLLPEIKFNISFDIEEQDKYKETFISMSNEEKKEMNNQIKKREILNGFVHGCAMHIWKSVHYIIKDKIDAINPNLMSLYDEYIASISWLIWQIYPNDFKQSINNEQMITQGFNELKFEKEDEPECNINCQAINFPVLLHEITKGAMDYLICKGIPKHFNKEELKYYYKKADSYENEVYQYLLSPTLWTKLIESTDVEIRKLPNVISNLSLLNYKELTEIMKIVIDDKKLGKQKLKEFKIL